jgi:decaprenyl-phosphate phosphoribosyltransferase
MAEPNKKMNFRTFVKLARPDHWFKNIFVVPGYLLATEFFQVGVLANLHRFVIGMIATCLVASANYVMNEWLDRTFDQYHPVKRFRPSVGGEVTAFGAWAEYAVLVTSGLLLSSLISEKFFATEAFLLVMGVIYNVKPFRSKDRLYLDVLSESINNPIRFVIGWYMISDDVFPPSSILLTYWLGGAFLMQIKRYSEYRFINNPEVAGLYRRSFRYYTENKLINASIFYAICSAILGGVFLVKYKIELILLAPFIALLYAWYFSIGLKPDSAAQHPEHMMQEKAFVGYVIFLSLLTVLLIKVHIEPLSILAQRIFP